MGRPQTLGGMGRGYAETPMEFLGPFALGDQFVKPVCQSDRTAPRRRHSSRQATRLLALGSGGRGEWKVTGKVYVCHRAVSLSCRMDEDRKLFVHMEAMSR